MLVMPSDVRQKSIKNLPERRRLTSVGYFLSLKSNIRKERKMEQRTKNIIADVCRVVFGLTFIVSGFTKTVDPWGTAIKISEYLNVYGFGELGDVRFGLAVLFCAAELMMGLLMLFKVKTRFVSIFAVLAMVFFTVLTFLSATWFPVEDCGCFGDAIHLSPWASFWKNVVLLALALIVWLNARRTMKFLPVTRYEWVCTVLFACMSVGLGVYCYRHLPIVDFLPYKKGLNLYDAVYAGNVADDDVRLVYRDTTDGSLHEFSAQDTTWYDTVRWEFVEQADSGPYETDMVLREFAVFNPEGDVTEDILGYGGTVYMMCAVKLDKVAPRCAERFAVVAERAAGENALAVCLTSTPVKAGETVSFGGGDPVAVYNVDATTMITMLRATTGLVVLDNGVITDKKNCRDIE